MNTVGELEVDVSFSPKASKELKSLKPVFKKLREVHQRYINLEPSSETSFWHRERAQTGLLAAAAWLSDKTALEEFGCDRQKRRGRRDLCIAINTKASFECEAKYLYVNLTKVEQSLTEVYACLTKAVEEARKARGGDAEYRLGLCFVAPRISRSRRGELDDRWRQFINGLKQKANGSSKYDALVRIHSPEPFPDEHNRLYPGLLLLVKEEEYV